MFKAIASLSGALSLQLVPRIGGLLRTIRNSRYNERRFLAASKSSSDAFFILESVRDQRGEIDDFRFDFANGNGAGLLSTTPEQLKGQLLCELFPFNRPDGFFDKYKRVVETGMPIFDEFAVHHDRINATWLRFQVVKLDDGVAITTTDITARKEAELRAVNAAAFTESIIASSPFAMIVAGLDGLIAGFNPAAERMLGFTRQEVIAKSTPLLFHDLGELETYAADHGIDVNGDQVFGNLPGVAFFLQNAVPGGTVETDCHYIRKDGSRLLVHLTVSGLIGPDGLSSGLICSAYDVTDRRRVEDRIFHLAHHDPLTGLPTRTLLSDRLENAIERARRNQTMVALFMIDMDNFKRVNDVLGHQAGDSVLVAASCRLLDSLRKSDTVARMGGDEFVVLLEEIRSAQEVERLAGKLVEVLSEPIRIEGHNLTISASVGVCVFPDGADVAPLMLKNADSAMYRAKARGRNTYQVFTSDMASATAIKRNMENALLDALALEEFGLVYQPQVSLATGQVTGMEALLRWRSGRLGMVMPNDFVPLAEETGMIVPIGAWVLRTACRQMREFSLKYGREFVIAVNVSPRQFENDELPRIIEEALAESGLQASSLEIEITENILISDSAKAVQVLDRVRALGVRIAIDDFGTGFSSMSYILRFNVDRLKIDQSFVRNLSEDPNSRAVTTAIIALAHGLKITVVAEGVETATHRDFLIGEGCDEAQGYYYARPVAMDALQTTMQAIDGSKLAATS